MKNVLLSVPVLVLNVSFIIAMALFYNEWGKPGEECQTSIFTLSLQRGEAFVNDFAA